MSSNLDLPEPLKLDERVYQPMTFDHIEMDDPESQKKNHWPVCLDHTTNISIQESEVLQANGVHIFADSGKGFRVVSGTLDIVSQHNIVPWCQHRL